jgi:cytochrome c
MRAKCGCAVVVFSLVVSISSCGLSADPAGLRRGAVAINRYGCGSCHTIPGIGGAHGLVGPTLSGIRSRVYIGGSLHNNTANLEQWIEDPHAVNAHTAMPSLRVTSGDAADITQYLYSLQ